MKNILLVLMASSLLLSCAKRPEDIQASYVSPLAYESYDCQQLGLEAQRISNRAAQVSGAQSKKATGDAVATGVALVLFWPAVFFIQGGSETEGEVARLKGEKEAVEQALIQKKCDVKFEEDDA